MNLELKVRVNYTKTCLYDSKCKILVQFSMDVVHILNDDCQWVVDEDGFSNCQYVLGVKGKVQVYIKSGGMDCDASPF